MAQVMRLRELMLLVLWGHTPLEWVSRSFLLGPKVMALRAKLALGHLAGQSTVSSLWSITTRGRSMLQGDQDRSERH
jgi:hypothetical protein